MGAQPLGSEGPSLNLGAATNSVTFGRCLDPSELQFCTLKMGVIRAMDMK